MKRDSKTKLKSLKKKATTLMMKEIDLTWFISKLMEHQRKSLT